MNYAWSHPETGVEQTADTAEEARYRAWEALQGHDGAHTDAWVQIWQQTPSVEVSRVSLKQIDLDVQGEYHSFAYASPINGLRNSYVFWEKLLPALRQELLDPRAADRTAVVVYRQRSYCWVHHSDPKPPKPAKAEQPKHAESEQITPASLLAELQATGGGPVAEWYKAIALLWIADALQKLEPFVLQWGEKTARRLHLFVHHPIIERTDCLVCGRPESDAIHGYTGD